ncbi:hypothetical protein FVEN_g240 [Fusarium venenatum]|nr:hypothetical protein FVEN_g240 [Fusarium venenatum]
MSTPRISLARPRGARIACRKCHSRKVKCSGGVPCNNCRQAECTAECTYPNRDRRIKVEQSYIDGLLEEIDRLRQIAQPTPASSQPLIPAERTSNVATDSSLVISTPSPKDSTLPAVNANSVHSTTESVDTIRNPLFDDRPWFFPLTFEMPILIGEATDVAFATRFRQEILGKSQNHFPRLQNLLEQAIRNPATCDLLSACKLFALFALGEAYSTRTCQAEENFPGIRYYISATRMLRVLCEEPKIDCVEIMVMLSIYSLAMNRRHSAYCIAGYALRFCIIIGLHLNVSPQQLPDRELREHRTRVWWSAYILDRSWASMLGKPISIQDEDIDVNMPSELQSLPPSDTASNDDFADTDNFSASIRLANLGAKITASLYSRRSHNTPFSSRVQQALQDLSHWLQGLPEPLRKCIEHVPPGSTMHAVTLHLYFNQCLILASRPILLHVLRLRRDSSMGTLEPGTESISASAIALSEACVECARRSYRVLSDSSINGSFPTFDYTYTQYLFSVAIVLAISSVLAECTTDGDDFETAAQILEQLDQNGSFAAKEFCRHIKATSNMLIQVHAEREQVGHGLAPALNDTMGHETELLVGPLLQDLLSQTELNLQFLEASAIDHGFQTFFWPEEQDDNCR